MTIITENESCVVAFSYGADYYADQGHYTKKTTSNKTLEIRITLK